MTSIKAYAWPLVADVVCVLAFALGGRDAHEPDDTWWVILRIAWPFLLALLIGTFLVVRRRLEPVRLWPGGVNVWIITYVLGMVLRGISGRGLAPGFLIVSILFLGVTMLGWRLLVRLWGRLRHSAS